MNEDHQVRTVVGWAAAVVVGLAVLTALGWLTGVVAAPWHGKGEAAKDKYSAENWTAAQARFEDLYAEIDITVPKITLAKQAADADPADKTAAQTLQGLQSYCLSVVGDYNADARKYLAEDFRSADLPEHIDTDTCEV